MKLPNIWPNRTIFYNDIFRFTINGEDQGVASTNVPSNVRAVIELVGHICQVRNLDTALVMRIYLLV